MVRDDLKYTQTHEWVKIDGDTAIIGITDYAQQEMGDIVYVELPDVDDEAVKGESFGSVEAVKAVEDINSPLSGTISEVNEALEDEPELVNKSAFDEGWLIKITGFKSDEVDDLLDSEEYKKLISEG